MDEKSKTWVIIGISVIVLVGVVSTMVLMEDNSLWSWIMLVTAVTLAITASLLAYKTRKEMRSGVVLEDERTITLNMKAGYRSFYASLYLFLFLAVAFTILEDRELDVSSSELVFILVALMGSIHIVLLTYYHLGRRSA